MGFCWALKPVFSKPVLGGTTGSPRSPVWRWEGAKTWTGLGKACTSDRLRQPMHSFVPEWVNECTSVLSAVALEGTSQGLGTGAAVTPVQPPPPAFILGALKAVLTSDGHVDGGPTPTAPSFLSQEGQTGGGFANVM